MFSSLLLISMVFSLKYRSILKFFRTFWDFSAIILSDYMSINLVGHSERIIGGAWFLASVLLLSIFSGELYDSLTRQQSIEKVENFDDLITKKYWINSKIYLIYWFGIFFPLLNDMAYKRDTILIKLNDRMDAIDSYDLLFKKDYRNSLINDIIENNSVLTVSSMISKYLMNVWKAEDYSNRNYVEDIDYHISKSCLEPYFFLTYDEYFNQTFNNKSSMDNFNAVLVNMSQILFIFIIDSAVEMSMVTEDNIEE